MGDIVQLIISGGIGAIIAAVITVLNYRFEKKIKGAEADTAQFGYFEKQIKFLNDRMDQLYKDLGKSDQEKRQSRIELEASETKRYKLKKCISCAHNCSNSDECPVLEMQREFEEEWILKNKEENK